MERARPNRGGKVEDEDEGEGEGEEKGEEGGMGVTFCSGSHRYFWFSHTLVVCIILSLKALRVLSHPKSWRRMSHRIPCLQKIPNPRETVHMHTGSG